MSGWRSILLSTVPTLWARPRAVIELGGGRLPHRYITQNRIFTTKSKLRK